MISFIKRAAIFVVLFFIFSCSNVPAGQIAKVSQVPALVNRDFLIQVSQKFYQSYPDQFDFLIFWGSPEFGPGFSFYLAVQNDVPGLGYQHNGPEFFDDGAEFGSGRLQGIIWMGPDWIQKPEDFTVNSILGTLAHETAHRWGASLRFEDASKGGVSDGLLGEIFHWSFFLDTGASPLRGNDWEDLGGGFFQANPVAEMMYSSLDLYLMGLITSPEVGPLTLLENVRNETGFEPIPFLNLSLRVLDPLKVQAEARRISIDQIIAVEGERIPGDGLNAQNLRQAWILLTPEGDSPDSDLSQRLESLRLVWEEYFKRATSGLGSVQTSLQ